MLVVESTSADGSIYCWGEEYVSFAVVQFSERFFGLVCTTGFLVELGHIFLVYPPINMEFEEDTEIANLLKSRWNFQSQEKTLKAP